MAQPRTNSQDEEPIFVADVVVNEEYKVIKRLGKGGYGEIYLVESLKTRQFLAMKCEKPTKSGSLKDEIRILRILRGNKRVPNILDHGSIELDEEHTIEYFTMDLLGDNLSNLRRRCTGGVFSIRTTMALGMQMLAALKYVHDAGFLHRDIKPGNFLVGKEKTELERSVIIIDFGLSRRHLLDDSNARPRRPHARWVGSRRYMSPNTHYRKDQGRRDDLWSFLYVLIEFCTGTLPWAHLRGLNNLDRVRDIKVDYMGEKLVKNLPAEFGLILNHIRTLGYGDRPDYAYLHKIMKQLYVAEGGTSTTPFDWQLVPTASGASDRDTNNNALADMTTGLSATESAVRLYQVDTASQPQDTSSDTVSDRESEQVSARQVHAKAAQNAEPPAILSPRGTVSDGKKNSKDQPSKEKPGDATGPTSPAHPKKRRCVIM